MISNVWPPQMDFFQQVVVVFLEETFAEFSKANTKFACPLLNTTGNTQPGFTCSKLTIKTLEQGVKYIQS